jgi:hypothetical protein
VTENLVVELRLLDPEERPAASWRTWLAPEIHRLASWQPGETVTISLPLALGHSPALASAHFGLSVFSAGHPTPLASIELSPWPQTVIPARPDPGASHRLDNVTFAGHLDLLGYDFAGRRNAAGGELLVALYWLNRQPLEPVEVEIEALADDGVVLARQRGPVPPPGDTVGWQTVSRHQLRLEVAPSSIVIKARPAGAEAWYQVHGPAGTAAGSLIIDDVLSKTVIALD